MGALTWVCGLCFCPVHTYRRRMCTFYLYDKFNLRNHKTLKSLGVVTFVNQTWSNYNTVPDSMLQQRKAIPSLCHGDRLKQLLERDTSTGLVWFGRNGDKGGEQRGGEPREVVERHFLFVVQLLPQPAAHRCDECRSFPTAVLWQQEVDVTLRSQFIYCLVHDPGETGQRQKHLTSC